MFSVYTVCFFGHRQIDEFRLVEHKVEELIDKLFTLAMENFNDKSEIEY